MRKASLVLYPLLLCLLFITVHGENNNQEEFLPIGLTEEELLRLDEIGINHQPTAPPSGVMRAVAEWEQNEGVIIRWPLGLSYSLIAEMSEDVMVTTIVASESQKSSAISAYTSNGVNMENTQFIIAPTNTIWTRDYGPWFIFDDNGDVGIVDHVYNRPRPDDDVIPQVLGSEWGIPVYGMSLVHTGGNHMCDGLGMSFSTRLIYNENPSWSVSEIQDTMLAYLGNEYTVLDYIESSGIHHIDCWAKLLNPTTILIKDVFPSNSSYELLNQRAEYLSQQISPWGKQYTIVRVFCPSGTAYTNSLILNNKVLVPVFGDSWDDDALQVYEDAMPGYEIIGFTGSWWDNDAIHCRTMGVPDMQMISIHHVPLQTTGDTLNDYLVTARIYPHSNGSLISDSLKIYYDDGKKMFESVPLYATADPDSFYGYIPTQRPGTQISYYLKADDDSGKVVTHPVIGAPWAHQFNINMPPDIVSPDSLLCRVNEEFGYYPEYVDIDDSTHQVEYSDYAAWMIERNDSLVGTSPDSHCVESFTVSVSDPYSADIQDVTLQVYRCGDPEGNNIVEISDAVYLIAYVFQSGPAPDPLIAGDVDCNDLVEVSDAVYLLAYIFQGGPPPCDGC